jgi:hypothetical protein
MAVKTVVRTAEQIRSMMHERLARDPELDGVDLRVFLYLSARVGFEEHLHIPQIELATALGRRKEQISRSIRKLVERGFILPSDEGSRASKWRLNPEFGK